MKKNERKRKKRRRKKNELISSSFVVCIRKINIQNTLFIQYFSFNSYKSDVRSTKHNRHNNNNHNNNNHHNHNRDYLLTSSTTSQSSVHVQSNSNHSSIEPAERMLRNGKRRGTYSTAASKADLFKIPEAPPSKTDDNLSTDKVHDTGSGAASSSTSVNDEDETNSISGEKTLVRNGVDDETGDNCSSRSVSPTTSGASTASSSPPPLIQEKTTTTTTTNNNNNVEQTVPSIPIDLSNSRTTSIKIEENSSTFNSVIQTSPSLPPSFLSSFTSKTSKSKSKEPLSTPPSLLSAHPFNNGLIFSPPTNPVSFLPQPLPPSFLHPSPNAFGLSPFHPPAPSHHSPTSNKTKLSPSTSISPSSYLPLPPQLYFNPLTTPRFPSVCSTSPSSSLSKSSR